MYSENGFAEGYAIGRDSNSNGNNGGFGWGGDSAWWIIILLIFGWGGNRGGGFGNGCGTGNCATQADLAAGFNNSAVLNSLNDLKLGQAGVQQTLCQGFNGVNTTMLQGFAGVDNAVCTLGYNTQQGFNNLSTQLAQCCCDTRSAIQDNTTQGVFNTNAIQKQISDCCCDIEKMNMQSRFDAQAYNCNTLQAIDKLGDRIIDFMSAEKAQALRDENFALKLQASQAQQNQYLINEIRPCPIPAYITCNPYAYQYQGYNNSCGGCNSCC